MCNNQLFHLFSTTVTVCILYLQPSTEFELTEPLQFTALIMFQKRCCSLMTLQCGFTVAFHLLLGSRVTSTHPFVTTWLMSGITKHSFPPFPINSLSLQHQGPPSPDPTARHSPYRCHSSESLDYLSGLMPKALSPAPYFPSGAGAVSRPSFTTVSSAGIGGCASPSASPVTVSALSHYSSSTAGLLEELQICSLDSPGASPTPSPTLSHASTYTTTAGPDDVLTTFVASTAAAASVTNVIIPTSHCCNTHHYQKQTVPSLPLLIWMAEPNFHKMCYYS